MRAGLVASTVTPGKTAADVSRTVPVIVACADASWGAIRSATAVAPTSVNTLCIPPPWFKECSWHNLRVRSASATGGSDDERHGKLNGR
jgi:hypothetical protein